MNRNSNKGTPPPKPPRNHPCDIVYWTDLDLQLAQYPFWAIVSDIEAIVSDIEAIVSDIEAIVSDIEAIVSDIEAIVSFLGNRIRYRSYLLIRYFCSLVVANQICQNTSAT